MSFCVVNLTAAYITNPDDAYGLSDVTSGPISEALLAIKAIKLFNLTNHCKPPVC